MLKGSFRDRHYNAGSILLGLGVLESVGGGINTYLRTGKLFPGPHLFAGAGRFLIHLGNQSTNTTTEYNFISFLLDFVRQPTLCYLLCHQTLFNKDNENYDDHL